MCTQAFVLVLNLATIFDTVKSIKMSFKITPSLCVLGSHSFEGRGPSDLVIYVIVYERTAAQLSRELN